ncbi:MAG: 3-phosphoshikimate 1-carboxyvinyltransferase [Pseudomonadota bacterium]
MTESFRAVVPPSGPIDGPVLLPGSKSLTNRALLLAACAKGTSRLSGALKSEDTQYMADALRAMNVTVREPSPDGFELESTGELSIPSQTLFLGNAGTAVRFLTALCATLPGSITLTGDQHMRRRPIGPLVATLRNAGVDIRDTDGCPPVTVAGTSHWRSPLDIDASLSSQYVSALLMASARTTAPIDIRLKSDAIGAKGYIALTIDLMRSFGIRVEALGSGYRVFPGRYQAGDHRIEADASAATYFWAAEKLTAGRIALGIDPHASGQPDAACFDIIQSHPNLPRRIDGAQMQDAIPTLAMVAALSHGCVQFVNVGGLRVKECDRITAICRGLNAIAPDIADEGADHFTIHGNRELRAHRAPVSIESYDDHRIAMSFAILGLRVAGLAIRNPDCVGKTYPNFWNALADLGVDTIDS